MDRRYYSPKKENKQHNAVIEKVRFTYKQGEFDLFLMFLKWEQAAVIHLINLFLKIQIDRRKEKWQNAQKEEKVMIILIH